MPEPLISNPDDVRLAMLGMVDGNGHPFSWSAIINGGYDKRLMAECGYPAISQYLDRQPAEALGLPGVRVTHVWCDRPEDARRVAATARVPHVVDRPEDVIGHVDAVVIATDIGHEHVERVRPFFEADLPAFIDKPLTDNREGLRQFTQWRREGKRFLSTSCMRYAREYTALRQRVGEVGELRAVTVLMAKSWERYGIHALEAAYPLLSAGGYEWVVNTGDANANVVHVRHRAGVDLVLVTTADLYGAFGQLQIAGTEGVLDARLSDTFDAFKTQLQAFVRYLRTGEEAVSYDQTRELMAMVIGGIESRERGGVRVALREVLT